MSDPTRRMGALAEPECRRIEAALELAEQQSLPVEWVAVVGAPDWSGTSLDWTAKVLRKIITFTQDGGELISSCRVSAWALKRIGMLKRP